MFELACCASLLAVVTDSGFSILLPVGGSTSASPVPLIRFPRFTGLRPREKSEYEFVVNQILFGFSRGLRYAGISRLNAGESKDIAAVYNQE